MTQPAKNVTPMTDPSLPPKRSSSTALMIVGFVAGVLTVIIAVRYFGRFW